MILPRRLLVCLVLLIVAPRPTLGEVLPRQEVDGIARPAVEGKWAMSFVVGLVDARERQVIGYGAKSEIDKSVPDGHTVYEIGSISKTFTATLLAEAVCRGELALDDPAQKYLPLGVKLPTGKGKPITLLHLATHSSGLGRMPTNFAPADPGNPYADYTLPQMYENLAVMKLLRDPGEECLYSNLGVALLGNILADRAHEGYESLLRDRICQPLRMQSTRIVFDESMRQRLAPPFDPDGGRLKTWDLPTFAGAGGIRSDVDDMLDYLSAELGLAAPELAPAIELTQTRRRAFDANNDIGLGWFIDRKNGYYWHNGQTGGYHSFVAFDRKKKVGAVVLCNTAGGIADMLGTRLIRRLQGQQVDPPALPQAIEVEEKILDRYVGEYKLGLMSWLTIRKAGHHLTARVTGQASYNIYPESKTQFFWKAVKAKVTFNVESDGTVTGLVLHQNGKDVKGERVK